VTIENGETRCAPIPGTARQFSRIRSGKVRTAQARIAAGYYDRDCVRAEVVDAVLEALRKG
jgi:hypothetical protein